MHIVRSTHYCAILCFFLTSITASITTKIIVFDLGGVLITYSKRKIGQQAPLKAWLGYMLCDRINPLNLRSIIFDILHRSASTDLSSWREERACDEKGNPLPAVLCALQCGMRPAATIRSQVIKTIERLAQAGYFVSHHEEEIIRAILAITFDPAQFARQFKPLKRGIKLLAQCAQAKDARGNPLHTVVILSNFDPESFDIIYQSPKYQPIFHHVPRQRILISGDTKSPCGLKPNVAIFQQLAKKLDVSPHDIAIIDDQYENLKAAETLGMTPIKFTKRSTLRSLTVQLNQHERRRAASALRNPAPS